MKIVKGTPQCRQLEGLLKDLNRTEETLVVSYTNEEGKLVQEYLNAVNYAKGNKKGKKLTRYSGVRTPYTVELIDGQIDEAKALLSDILENAVVPNRPVAKIETRTNASNLRCFGGDLHEIEKF